jgi:hypothetical protein
MAPNSRPTLQKPVRFEFIKFRGRSGMSNGNPMDWQRDLTLIVVSKTLPPLPISSASAIEHSSALHEIDLVSALLS